MAGRPKRCQRSADLCHHHVAELPYGYCSGRFGRWFHASDLEQASGVWRALGTRGNGEVVGEFTAMSWHRASGREPETTSLSRPIAEVAAASSLAPSFPVLQDQWRREHSRPRLQRSYLFRKPEITPGQSGCSPRWPQHNWHRKVRSLSGERLLHSRPKVNVQATNQIHQQSVQGKVLRRFNDDLTVEPAQFRFALGINIVIDFHHSLTKLTLAGPAGVFTRAAKPSPVLAEHRRTGRPGYSFSIKSCSIRDILQR